MVIGDEVVHREAVVGGQEVQRTRGRGEQVGTASQALHHLGNHSWCAAQEAADVVAELPVPLHPALIGKVRSEEVPSHVPRLGDQAHATTFTPVTDGTHEVGIAGEHGGEIEPEAVDAEVGEPVERLHDQAARLRRVVRR